MNASTEFPNRHRLSVADYFQMAETGILARDARVELIYGEIIEMVPIGSRHAGFVNRLNRLLFRAVQNHAVVSIQNPLILGDSSVPEPDLCLLRPRDDDYIDSHPQADDVLLTIEVADSSLVYDRDIKVALYASYGIPEFWLIDVSSRQLARYTQVGVDTYRSVLTSSEAGVLSLVALPKTTVDLSTLF